MARDEPRGALVGRGSELKTLVGALDRAAAGEAGVVLVSGDAGVGKTRLVGELAATARERGCTVLLGQCAELGESIPYLPLADALWTASRDPEAGPDRREALRAAVRARPVLGRLLPDSPEAPEEAGRELAQQRLFGAALGLLGELADADPVLLVFEDLHWADRSTRHLLTFLSRVLQRERVCLVGTYRSDDLYRRHPLRPVVAELLRLPNVSPVELGPFGPEETAAYLASLGGAPPAPRVVDRVYARSEGNPFFAAELFAASRTGDELPAGLADLLMARVERLSEAAQRVVRVAAVAGRRVNDELVRKVSGLDEADCEAALREIVSHRLLVPDGADGYTFRHSLLREAVRADLLPGEDVRLHAAFAALLAETPERRGAAAELAYHSMAAHDLPTAFAAALRAAGEAERIGAPDEAHEYYDRALSLWDAVPEPEAAAGMDRPRLLLRSAAAADDSGDSRRALSLLRRLLEVLDRRDVLLEAEVRERIAYYLGNVDMNIDVEKESATMARSAIDLLPRGEPTPQRARALATLCRTLLYTERHPEIPALAEEAISVARAAGAPDAEASALVSLGIYTESQDGRPSIAEMFARARELAESCGDLQVALRAAFHHARTIFDRGDLAGAQATADEGVRFTLDAGLGWSPYGINLRFLQYLMYYTSGDWERAARIGDGFGVRVGRMAEAQISVYALFLEVAQGSDVAGERLRQLAPYWPEDNFLAYMTCGLAADRALWQGDPAAALGDVRSALDALDPYDAGVIRVATTGLTAYAEGAGPGGAGVPDPDALLGLARGAARRTAGGKQRRWLGLEGKAWLARAEAERHRIAGDDTPDMWRRVVDAFDYGYVYEVARSRWRLAASLVVSGDRAAAESEWRAATDAAARLGAAPLGRALADLGRRAGFAAEPSARPSGPLAGLTEREHEVLRLVAEGRNNREIAALLFISPKTASVHVSNILAKLGVTSRTQAAAVAHRAGGPGGGSAGGSTGDAGAR